MTWMGRMLSMCPNFHVVIAARIAELGWTISGPDLPDDVLRTVYGGNARNVIPGIGS